ncbi:MAG: hypothetical protein RL404_817 [Pseudomonadota bacterium]|jgi:diguanylate cyclase (GGDEF)-like protein/PAS domain S-box-containing protein
MASTLQPPLLPALDAPDTELASLRAELVRTREALREQNEKLHSTFELPSVGMAHVDLDGKWLAVNDTLCGIVGYSREELLQLTFQDITHPDDLDEDLALVQKLLTGELANYSLEKRYLRKGGAQIWIRLTAKLTRDSAGEPWFFVSVIENIHDRKLAEQERLAVKQALQASESRFRIAFDNIPDVVVIYDHDLRIQYINPATIRTTGMAPEAFLGKRESEIFPADLIAPWQPALLAALHEGRVTSVEIDVPLNPGVRNLLITCVPLRDQNGEVKEVMGITHDFTDRKRAEEATVKAALHDNLTGLPNRALLFEYSSHVFDQAARNQHEGGMLFIDLDRFKPINDIHGHLVGDQVLKIVAHRVQCQVRKADLVFRLGGDEFLVLLPQLANSTEAAQIAQRVLRALADPMLVDGIELQISGSIGISIFPRDGMDMQSLVNAADNAMYHAKQSGKNNWQFYSAELSGRVHAQISLQDKVRRALKDRELQLLYQPIIDISEGRVIGAEALLRWPGSGVGPDQFIPAAEAVGQIIPIGDWVMQEACRAHKRWRDRGLPAIPISVNVSALQIRQKDFRIKLMSMLRQQRLPACALQIELTESALLEDMDYAGHLLTNLQQDGVKISLDDFGTGYSSLSYLSRLPINKIKIDKSFVRHLNTDATSRAVTEAIITLGRRLKLDIIAEGIETQTMLDEVRALGCEQMQGHLLSHPIDSDAFESWYASQRPAPH